MDSRDSRSGLGFMEEGGLKNILIALGVCVFIFIVAVIFITVNFTYRIDPGQVGLLVDYMHKGGDGKPDVTVEPQGSFVWYNSWGGQSMFEYPISLQTLSMVANPAEGNQSGDDSVVFLTQQGIPLRVDVTTQWRVIDPAKLYFLMPGVKLSGDFNNDVSTKLIRQSVIHSLTNNGSKYQWQDIAGSENAISSAMQKELAPIMARYGIEIEQVSLGQLHYSKEQQAAIDALTTAQQQALQAQFEKQKQGYLADAARIAAESQAAQIAIINKELAQSPQYLQYLQIQKWDGKLPGVLSTNGGNTLLAPFQK